MTTALFTHPACLQHDTGSGHPERMQRLSAVLQGLKGQELAAVKWREAPRAEIEQIVRSHDEEYVRAAWPRSRSAAGRISTAIRWYHPVPARRRCAPPAP